MCNNLLYNMNKRKLWFFIKALFGISLFYYFIRYKIDLSVLSDIKMTYLFLFYSLLAVLNSLLIIVIRTIRWQYMLRKYYGKSINFWETQRIIYIGQFFSLFTPSRLGDIGRVKYIKKDFGLTRSTSSIILERTFDILVILIALIISFFAFRHKLEFLFQKFSPTIIIALIVVGIIILILGYYKLRNTNFMKVFFCFAKKIDFQSFCMIFLLSSIIWLLTFIQVYVFALSIGIHISLISVIQISGIMSFFCLLPITVASIGTTEISAFYFLPLIGIMPGAGEIILWLDNITISFIPAIIGYFFYSTYQKQKK